MIWWVSAQRRHHQLHALIFSIAFARLIDWLVRDSWNSSFLVVRCWVLIGWMSQFSVAIVIHYGVWSEIEAWVLLHALWIYESCSILFGIYVWLLVLRPQVKLGSCQAIGLFAKDLGREHGLIMFSIRRVFDALKARRNISSIRRLFSTVCSQARSCRLGSSKRGSLIQKLSLKHICSLGLPLIVCISSIIHLVVYAYLLLLIWCRWNWSASTHFGLNLFYVSLLYAHAIYYSIIQLLSLHEGIKSVWSLLYGGSLSLLFG